MSIIESKSVITRASESRRNLRHTEMKIALWIYYARIAVWVSCPGSENYFQLLCFTNGACEKLTLKLPSCKQEQLNAMYLSCPPPLPPPLRESQDRGEVLVLWLLLTAASGLINANAKWQCQSDELLTQLGSILVCLMPHLFMPPSGVSSPQPPALLANVFDEMMITGPDIVVKNIISLLHDRFPLGTVTKGHALLHFFELNITQNDDNTVIIDDDD